MGFPSAPFLISFGSNVSFVCHWTDTFLLVGNLDAQLLELSKKNKFIIRQTGTKIFWRESINFAFDENPDLRYQ